MRTHGTGCIDMNELWRPFPLFNAGHDAFDDNNYNWAISDACMASIYANQQVHPLSPSLLDPSVCISSPCPSLILCLLSSCVPPLHSDE